MPTFDQSIVSVSGRIGHERDFTFYKNNGDIANLLQKQLSSTPKEITIDTDGDIEIEMADVGTIIATSSAAIAVGWATNPKMLSAQQEIEKFANVLERLVKLKGSFAVELYGIGLFFRFRPENALNLLRERGLESSLQLIFSEKAPPDIASLKSSTTRSKGKFLDTVELEASSKDARLRYSRNGKGADFDSYLAFVAAASLTDMLAELKPFAEILLAAEPRLGLRLGGSPR
jgi:hypothetical protein